jgi:hypothetical protein
LRVVEEFLGVVRVRRDIFLCFSSDEFNSQRDHCAQDQGSTVALTVIYQEWWSNKSSDSSFADHY